MIRIPDGNIKCSTCVRPENAKIHGISTVAFVQAKPKSTHSQLTKLIAKNFVTYSHINYSPLKAEVSIFSIGLYDNKINLTLDVPANAFVSTRKILLWLNRMVVIFWRPANANWATVANGVCWMEISRIFGRPRNANGLIVVILLPSRDNFLRLRRPANASLLIIGKLFLVSDRFSTLNGNRFVGISRNPPVLHRTCEQRKTRERTTYSKCFSNLSKSNPQFAQIWSEKKCVKAKPWIYAWWIRNLIISKGSLMNPQKKKHTMKKTFMMDITHLCLR